MSKILKKYDSSFRLYQVFFEKNWRIYDNFYDFLSN